MANARNQESIADVDVDLKPAATPAQLAKVINKAREQYKAEMKIEKIEKELKIANAELKLIQTKQLPDLMSELSMEACPLDKGYIVELKTGITASIPSPDSKDVENAFERNRAGVLYIRKVAPDLLKNQIVINFGIKEESFFKKVIRDIKQRKKELDYSVKTTVYSGTLGKWVRGQEALGKSVDEAALNVYRFKKTVLIPPKKKGAKEKV